MSSSESEDQSSVLGRKEHWEEAYAAELATFRESQGAYAGEVWFGEDTQATMVELVARVAGASSLPQGEVGGRDAWRVLDLGCGNGALCVALARAGCVLRTCLCKRGEEAADMWWAVSASPPYWAWTT